MHPVSGMDEFMQLSGLHYGQESEEQLFMMEGIHNSLDFDMSTLPDFMLPGSELPNMIGFDTIEEMPRASKASSESLNRSAYTLSAYHSREGSTSSTSSLELPTQKHRSTSTYHNVFQEPEAVIAAQEGWPCFRCNPPTSSKFCPKTARLYLEGLEQTLKNQDAWNAWAMQTDELERATAPRISTEPFAGCTRDKLLAITQSFLHKALEIHRTGLVGSPEDCGSVDSSCAEFIILPPPNVLEDFLRAYVGRFEPYYSFVPSGVLKPNELMQLSNGKASSLLLLLMVAQGAMATPTVEARYLTSGLTEACRISLFDIIEKDIVLSSDPIVLRCAVLFTTLAAWSGDKWHMDVGSLSASKI